MLRGPARLLNPLRGFQPSLRAVRVAVLASTCRCPSPFAVPRNSSSSGSCAYRHATAAFHVSRLCAMRAAAPSAVNVEEFTLNEDVVKKDMEDLARWNELSEAIEAARGANDQKEILSLVSKGLALLDEIGTSGAPIQCESLLCLEGSQAHYNIGNFADALTLAQRARQSLTEGIELERQDRAQVAEIEQLIGFILYKDGKAKEAHEVFAKVLHWIDVDAKTAMPMQAVAAVNQRRIVLSGIGQSLALQADGLAKNGSAAEAKELYSKGLDTLIEALNQHIDENDFEMVKTTLRSILQCFEGLDDVEQAVTTCRKYISWCRRHDDAAGVAEGEKVLADLCARHGIADPSAAAEESAGQQ